MKYIDADLLRKEVEKRMHICDGVFERDSDTYYQGKAVAYQETLSFIDSLQQEQPKKSKKDCNGCPHCVDRKDQYGWHFKGCFGGPYKGKFIAEIDECPLQQEQSSEDLNDEIKKFIEEYGYERGEDKLLIAIVARHFAEWQKEKMMKEMFAEQGTTEEEYLDKSMVQVREMYKKLGITMAKEDKQ